MDGGELQALGMGTRGATVPGVPLGHSPLYHTAYYSSYAALPSLGHDRP